MGRLPEWARHGRTGWRFDGTERPEFAVDPRAGQESVWDYPRPPRLERDSREVVVRRGRQVVARTTAAWRVLETASPPTFYVPIHDVVPGCLRRAAGGSRCEWKGEAVYWDVVLEDRVIERAAWSYPAPFEEFAPIAGFPSFYPGRIECYVDGEPVRPQPGLFYGGWVTSEIVGPMKGEPGSEAW